MSEVKHTPGPWQLDKDFMWEVFGGGNGYLVAKVNPPHTSVRGKALDEDFECCKANARLISSAPELLEVLKSLVDCISETRGKNANDSLERAKIVIARSEGTD